MSIENTLRVIIREEITRALAMHKETSTEPLNDFPLIMDAKDVSRALKCSLRTAYAVMEEDGFPLVRIRKMKRVNSKDFFEWLRKTKGK